MMSFSSKKEQLLTGVKANKDLVIYFAGSFATALAVHHIKKLSREQYRAEGSTLLPEYVFDHMGNGPLAITTVACLTVWSLFLKGGRFKHPIASGIGLGMGGAAVNLLAELPAADGIIESLEVRAESGLNTNVPDPIDLQVGAATSLVMGLVSGLIFRQRNYPEAAGADSPTVARAVPPSANGQQAT